ncbi:MAG TPA: stage II sporulation protein M [Solirubrobacteraceae bacterium]|nr:stage II sporulation protein M [Solirubrobacteraceae bacterium]
MNLEAFLVERTPAWDALERDLADTRRPGRNPPERTLELGRTYRAVVADLAYARRRFPGDPIVDRLERLALAGRQVIYSGRRRNARALVEFATTGYWRLVIGQPGVLAIAVIALAGPCVLAAIWALHDPAAALGLVPGVFKGAAHPHVRHLPLGAATQALLASSIFTNNIRVAFLAFAGGLTLGFGTIGLLAYNGALLGALAGITIQAGNFSVFVRYVASHGLLELSCIAVSGAAGLRLAWAVIDPGTLPRGVSLRAAARPAVLLALGTAPWLVAAGLTEGFVTPLGLPLGAALAVGLFWFALYWGLVAVRGRDHSRARALASR